MLTTTKLLRLLKFNFARRVKTTNIDLTPPTIISKQQQNIPQSSIFSKPVTFTPLQENQLAQQIQPISLESINAYKQKTKAAIIQEISYQGQDPNPNKLVNRPAKGVVWGLGGQLVLANRKMQLQGVRDQPEQVIKFLQLQQVKNIYIHDWSKLEDSTINRRRYSIIGSCFSARHCWKVAIQLKNAFNKHMLNKKRGRNKKFDAITALMIGRKDQQWTLVQYKQFQVSLMTEQQREAVDLQWKWNNPVPQDIVQKNTKMNMDKKKRKGSNEKFD